MSESKDLQSFLKALNSREDHATTQEWLDSIFDEIPDEDNLTEDTLARLKTRLRISYGSEYQVVGDDFAEHISFWSRLADRFPDCPELTIIAADTKLLAEMEDEAADMFLDGLNRAPHLLSEYGGDLYELFESKGPDYFFQYELLTLHSYLAKKICESEDIDELLEKYKDQPERLDKIHSLLQKYQEA